MFNAWKILRRSGEGVKGRCLPWSKGEEGAYIFWMKQVPVIRNPRWEQKRAEGYVIVSIRTRAA
jgi:hypothetical protein